jgi:hypothetical protein
VRRAIDGLPRQLGRFIAEVYDAEAVEEAWDEFTLWEGVEFDPESPLMAIFMPWLYHSWEPDPYETIVEESLHGRPPARVFLERRAARLDPLLQRYLQECLASPFSFHEILRCDRGRGFRARDGITGEEHEVLERSATESMSAGDILFGQLVPIDGIVLLEACSPYPLSPIDKIAIVELRAYLEDEASVDPDAGDWRRDWEIEVRELYLLLIERFIDPRPPTMHNTDGDLVKLQSVIFDVDDADAAFTGLAQAGLDAEEADVERAADGRLEHAQFSWIKPGNRLHASWENTILGSIEITGTRLVAHVNSDERAQAFRAVVEQALGTAARYVGGEVIDRNEPGAEPVLARGEPQTGDDAQQLADSPQIREHLSRRLERHYEDWVTQEIPALGHRRPIDVVREANGREKVEAVVAEMERHAARLQPGVGEAALERLRERLGLARR